MKINTDPEVEYLMDSLEMPAHSKVLRKINLLENFSLSLGMPHVRSMGEGLFELRVRGSQEVRIFYCYYKDQIYMLSGFIKKTQQTPEREILKARNKYKFLTS